VAWHPQYGGNGASRHCEREGVMRLGPKVATYFWQQCPACGRTLRIRVEHLGDEIVCRHCRRRFTALDETMSRKMPCLAEPKIL